MADPVAELTPQVEDELAVAPALLVEALLVHLPLVSGLESPLQLATEHVEEIEGIVQSVKTQVITSSKNYLLRDQSLSHPRNFARRFIARRQDGSCFGFELVSEIFLVRLHVVVFEVIVEK